MCLWGSTIADESLKFTMKRKLESGFWKLGWLRLMNSVAFSRAYPFVNGRVEDHQCRKWTGIVDEEVQPVNVKCNIQTILSPTGCHYTINFNFFLPVDFFFIFHFPKSKIENRLHLNYFPRECISAFQNLEFR